MDIVIYNKYGDLSNARGLVLSSFSYDDRFFGKPDINGEEITEEEYENLLTEMKNYKRGFEGYVNDEGYSKYLQRLAELGE